MPACARWSSRVRQPLPDLDPLPSERARPQVERTLQVAGHPNLFALGDACDMPEEKLAYLAQVCWGDSNVQRAWLRVCFGEGAWRRLHPARARSMCHACRPAPAGREPLSRRELGTAARRAAAGVTAAALDPVRDGAATDNGDGDTAHAPCHATPSQAHASVAAANIAALAAAKAAEPAAGGGKGAAAAAAPAEVPAAAASAPKLSVWKPGMGLPTIMMVSLGRRCRGGAGCSWGGGDWRGESGGWEWPGFGPAAVRWLHWQLQMLPACGDGTQAWLIAPSREVLGDLNGPSPTKPPPPTHTAMALRTWPTSQSAAGCCPKSRT